ncbi:GPN-loop GTPase 3 [Fusarium oxysporum f. sp. albedinis]|nr:GPN-loop GTPase 3 [Fusarium oxysporum f. sp. albedinis]
METTSQQAKGKGRAHQDQMMIHMIKCLRHLSPRTTRPARSSRSSSIRLARSRRRPRSSTFSANHSNDRLSKDDLFWPPSEVTNAQLSDPTTRILMNTAEGTIISCVVNGGTMHYFGIPPCRTSRARG